MVEKRKRLAVVGLKEEDLDLVPSLLRDERWELVALADEDPASVVLRLGEVMRLPVTSSLSSLADLGLDVAVCGSEETERALGEILGGRTVTMTPADALRPGREAPEPSQAEEETQMGIRGGPEPCVPAEAGERRREPESSEADALGDLAKTLNLALDKQKLLRWILELGISCTGADSGSIMLLDETGEQLSIAVAFGLSNETVRRTRQRVGEGIAGKVAKDGQPLLISGEPDAEGFKKPRERSNIKAAMCVPLIAKGRTVGVLNVSSFRDYEAFQEKDLHLLEKMAERVTEVLQRAIEYSTITNRALEFTLREIAEEEIGRETPLEDKLCRLAVSLANRIQADCCIYLPDRDIPEKLLLAAASSPEVRLRLPAEVIRGKGFLGRAAASGRPLALLPGSLVSPNLEGDDLGMLCIPLVTERLQGLVVFDSAKVSDTELEGLLGALERAGRFIAKELSRETSLRGLKEQAAALGEFNQAVSSMMAAQKVEDVLRVITAEGTRMLKADVGVVVCEDGRTWFVDRLQGVEGVEEDEEIARARELLCAEALKEMSFISSGSVDETLNLELERLSVSSFVAGPLKADPKFLGVCILIRKGVKKREAFTKADTDCFKSFCGYAAHGLQKALVSVQAQQFSERDSESGLLGTEAILKKIEEESKRYERYGIGFCISLVEIEGLTAAFQRFGDQWRGAFLEEFCGALRRTIREVDAVGRTGEAVFVVVSPQTPREGGIILQRIEELLRRIGAVRYVSPAPELKFKGRQVYWPKDVSDLGKASEVVMKRLE
ncbi:MAG: GAF domain-containing protein [Candidatus Eisenbacteria bacterium]